VLALLPIAIRFEIDRVVGKIDLKLFELVWVTCLPSKTMTQAKGLTVGSGLALQDLI
jgi:hypothetical protein